MLKSLRPVMGLCYSAALNPLKISSASFRTWSPSDEPIYTDDHVQIQKTLRKIIDKDINPYVDAWEEQKDFPIHEVFKTLGDAGLLGVNKPVEYGGLGLDYSFAIAIAEELGNVKCGAVPMAVTIQTDMATPALAKFGSHELKERFLAPSIAGEFVSCLGVSETGSGSDVASVRTKAIADGDDLVINGEKMWITNSDHADWMCLLACTNDTGPHTNKSLICVPMDSPGISVVEKVNKLGMLSSNSCRVVFEDVRVPRSYTIGEEGAGFRYQMIQFQEERIVTACIALNLMQLAIDSTIDYTRNRKIFAGSVLDNQVVHFKLAEMQTEVEALRSMLYRTAALYMKGNDVTPLVSMLKLKTGRISRELTDSCLQFWGGMGYCMDSVVTRCYRDARLGSIGGGADEVMLTVLCRYMGVLPKLKK